MLPRHKPIIETCVIFGALEQNAEESLSDSAYMHTLSFSVSCIQGRGHIVRFLSGLQPPPSRPSYSPCSDFCLAMAIGRQCGGGAATPQGQTSTPDSLFSGMSAHCDVLSKRPSRRVLEEPSWLDAHAFPSFSHCNTNSTVPCRACTGSSSSNSRRPSSFRARPRW